jgi:glycine/D-amino acid oxidase-like deaminating enzyme
MPDAVVIGGGFYGASIAHYLKAVRGLRDVVLLERGRRLMERSSFVNQARVHNGYHYPRSFTTAYRSRANFPRFIEEFQPVIFDSFTKIYALARRNSKITMKQMQRFCRAIGAPLAPAPDDLVRLFEPRLIESIFLVVEHAFNADALRRIMTERLEQAGVTVRLGAEITHTESRPETVAIEGAGFALTAPVAFNCTYSRLQHTLGRRERGILGLKHEITEIALVEPPPQLAGIGVTVMDGAFFSCMPSPAWGLHSLSHVRYTPHRGWRETAEVDPYEVLASYHKGSRVDRMILDAARYMPLIRRCRPVDALFEVKTVLVKNEGDDGRPILFERHAPFGRLFSVLGGKIDNIYDILERLDAEPLPEAG